MKVPILVTISILMLSASVCHSTDQPSVCADPEAIKKFPHHELPIEPSFFGSENYEKIVKRFERNSIRLVKIRDLYAFVGWDALHGQELRTFDPTTKAFSLVKDINPGPASGVPELVYVNNRGLVYLIGGDGTHGESLWISDLSQKGTVQLSDKIHGRDQLRYLWFVSPDQNIDCFGYSPNKQRDSVVWETDGTPEGTRMVYVPPARYFGFLELHRFYQYLILFFFSLIPNFIIARIFSHHQPLFVKSLTVIFSSVLFPISGYTLFSGAIIWAIITVLFAIPALLTIVSPIVFHCICARSNLDQKKKVAILIFAFAVSSAMTIITYAGLQ